MLYIIIEITGRTLIALEFIFTPEMTLTPSLSNVRQLIDLTIVSETISCKRGLKEIFPEL